MPQAILICEHNIVKSDARDIATLVEILEWKHHIASELQSQLTTLVVQNENIQWDLKGVFDAICINILGSDGKGLLGNEIVKKTFYEKVEDTPSVTNASPK